MESPALVPASAALEDLFGHLTEQYDCSAGSLGKGVETPSKPSNDALDRPLVSLRIKRLSVVHNHQTGLRSPPRLGLLEKHVRLDQLIADDDPPGPLGPSKRHTELFCKCCCRRLYVKSPELERANSEGTGKLAVGDEATWVLKEKPDPAMASSGSTFE